MEHTLYQGERWVRLLPPSPCHKRPSQLASSRAPARQRLVSGRHFGRASYRRTAQQGSAPWGSFRTGETSIQEGGRSPVSETPCATSNTNSNRPSFWPPPPVYQKILCFARHLALPSCIAASPFASPWGFCRVSCFREGGISHWDCSCKPCLAILHGQQAPDDPLLGGCKNTFNKETRRTSNLCLAHRYNFCLFALPGRMTILSLSSSSPPPFATNHFLVDIEQDDNTPLNQQTYTAGLV